MEKFASTTGKNREITDKITSLPNIIGIYEESEEHSRRQNMSQSNATSWNHLNVVNNQRTNSLTAEKLD